MKINQRVLIGLIVFLVSFIMVLLFVMVFKIEIKPRSKISKNPIPTPTSVEPQQGFAYYLDKVAPEQGFTVNIKWGDVGKKIVAAGGIDLAKFKQNYTDDQYKEILTFLMETKDQPITITRENAYFWVNTLWALGLTQKSDVLDKGIMKTKYSDNLGNFASTGGWSLGAKPAVKLYSSKDILGLTPAQQALVVKVSANIYRPCCGNPTSFPDCNHGMAILGLLELMASQGADEDQMYKAALAFNSYWFTNTYADLAYYFKTKENKDWSQVDAKRVLSAKYSSAGGYQAIKQQIGNIPGTQTQGGSCGA